MTNISNQNKVPYQGQIQRKKELKDLNMMDAFLFDALTEKPEDAKVIARTIVRRVLGHDLREMVVENKELVYNDGVVKLFLYTKGKRGGSEDLKSLLIYFEETTQDNVVDAELLEIQRIVGTVKRSKLTYLKGMTSKIISKKSCRYSRVL